MVTHFHEGTSWDIVYCPLHFCLCDSQFFDLHFSLVVLGKHDFFSVNV